MSNLRDDFINASRLHFKAGIEKHRVNVENLMRNSMGIGEHGDLMDEIEKELGYFEVEVGTSKNILND